MLHLVAAAAAAFNLVCTGVVEKRDINGARSEPYSVTYRIDLNARLWCMGNDEECKTPERLADVNPLVIKFSDSTTDTPTRFFRYVDLVNRETGEHQFLSVYGREAAMRMTSKKGQCTPAPFTGFTKVAPKF